MELTGLKISMDLDLDKLSKSISLAENQIIGFSKQLSSAFKSMPDLNKKFNINVKNINNIGRESQDAVNLAKEYAILAKARLDEARLIDIQERAKERLSKASKAEKDEYGQLTAEMNKQVRAYLNAAANLHRLGDASEYTAEQVAQMAQEARKGQEALLKMESAVGRNQRNVGNYASGLNAMGNSINQITRELPAFTYSMQTGFMAISNNIPAVADAIKGLNEQNKQLTAQGKATIPVWKQVASSLLSWQTVMSLGITVLTVYGAEIVETIFGLKEKSKATEEAKKRQESFNDAVNSYAKVAGDEIGKLRQLQSVMTNTNISLKARQEAYKEAVSMYPAYLKQISEEDALNGGLANTINSKLIPAIIAKARAQAYANKIGLIETEILKIQDELNKALSRRVKLQNDVNKSIPKDIQMGKSDMGAWSNFANAKELDDVEESIKNFQSALNDLNQQQHDAGIMVSNLTTQSWELATTQDKTTKSIKNKANELKKLSDVEKEYNDSLEELLNKGMLNQTADDIEYFTERVKILKDFLLKSVSSNLIDPLNIDSSRIQEGVKEVEMYENLINRLVNERERLKKVSEIGVNLKEGLSNAMVDPKRMNQLTQSLDSYQKAIVALEKIGQGGLSGLKLIANTLSQSIESEKEKERLKGFREEIEKIFKLQDAGFITTLDASNQRLSKYNEELKRAIENGDIITQKKIQIIVDTEQAKNSIEQLNSSFSKLALDTATRVPEEIGKGIGDALTGKGSLFGSFISMLGDQLQELGKIMIKFGTIKLGIDTALQSIALPFTGGLGAIAAGVASVAAGQIIKASASKRTRSFASGGIVYDETYARVGEYANAGSNPEIIAPLNKLTPLISNAINNRPNNDFNGAIAVETRVSGTDLLLLLKRAEKQYNR